jgi:hypothetical protein
MQLGTRLGRRGRNDSRGDGVNSSSRDAPLDVMPASGLGLKHDPYMYRSRAGLFDYAFGHMNNAAYLTHAELARWEMLSYTGLLLHGARTSTHLVVAGTAVRYRQEIRPFLCPFEVETFFAGIDRRYVWSVHNFRRRRQGTKDRRKGEDDSADERIRSQIIVPCVWVRKGSVVEPASYLIDAGVDKATIDSLLSFGEEDADHQQSRSNDSSDEKQQGVGSMSDMAVRYAALEEWMRRYASIRDNERARDPLPSQK